MRILFSLIRMEIRCRVELHPKGASSLSNSCCSIYIFWFWYTLTLIIFAHFFRIWHLILATLLAHWGFADQTAQLSRSEKMSQTLYSCLFINVKTYHPSGPTALKAVCDQENPTTLSTCPRAVLKRETQAQRLSAARLAALLPKTARRNLQTSGCALWLKIHSNRGGILVQSYFSSSD